MKKLNYLGVVTLAMATILPAMASANSDLNINANGTVGIKEDSIKVREDSSVKSDNEDSSAKEDSVIEQRFSDHLTGWGNLFNFQAGIVTAVGLDNFTMTTRDGTSIIVNTAGAKLIRLYHTVIGLADIHVNDRVWVQGDAQLNQINALVAYDLDANTKPASLKGTVTAVSANSFTVATKNKGTVIVNTDGNTNIKEDGKPTSTSAIMIGSEVIVKGLWNTLLNIFTAIRVRIK